METPIATSEHNHRTLKNKDGNFPKWMSKTKVDKHKKVIKKKKAVKKLAQKQPDFGEAMSILIQLMLEICTSAMDRPE